MVCQHFAQALEIAQPKRHRATPGRSARRVGETDEPLAARSLEQLNDLSLIHISEPTRLM